MALDAARDAAGGQDYPLGTLFVVATPIGNLADISLRALHVLQLVDVVACEDTRHTRSLLRAYGIDKSHQELVAVHQHNEAQAAQHIVERLRTGQRVAYVSDAGTPGVSDPGARLVQEVSACGLRCIPLPGASSVTSAVSIAGLVATAAGDRGFIFAGFLPAKAGERQTAVNALVDEPRAVVLLEAPHRIADLAAALAVLGPRRVTLARELTKQFEEVSTHPAQELAAWLDAMPHRAKGEFVVVLHPAEVVGNLDHEGQRVLALLMKELPTKTAVRLAAEITGAARNRLYDLAIATKDG